MRRGSPFSPLLLALLPVRRARRKAWSPRSPTMPSRSPPTSPASRSSCSAPCAARPADDTDYQVAVVVQGPTRTSWCAARSGCSASGRTATSREFAERAVLLRHASQRELQRRADARRARAVPAGRAEPALRAGSERRRHRRALRRRADRPEERARALSWSAATRSSSLRPNVFRTTFFLPSDIPTGEYRVSVYLFRGEAFLAGETQTAEDREGRLLRAHRARRGRLSARLRARLRGAALLHRLVRGRDFQAGRDSCRLDAP